MGKTIKLLNDTYLVNDYYSTDEIVIGKWVNGKTIYRKAINFILNSQWQLIGNIPNIQNVIHIYGSSGIGYTIPYYRNSTNYVTFYIGSNGNIMCDSGSSDNDRYGYCIIEYTKTTD